jgi:hypothetical protein
MNYYSEGLFCQSKGYEIDGQTFKSLESAIKYLKSVCFMTNAEATSYCSRIASVYFNNTLGNVKVGERYA